jgi:hypothetical protein
VKTHQRAESWLRDVSVAAVIGLAITAILIILFLAVLLP